MLKMKHRSKTPDYKIRAAALKKLGFTSYREYLESDLWATIRRKVLGRDPVCRLCRNARSTQVHHYRYTLQVMKGNTRQLRFLIGVCADCHREVEFEGERKRSPTEVARAARKKQKILKDSS